MNKLALAFALVVPCAGCVVSSGPNRGEELDRKLKSRTEATQADLAAPRADKAAGRSSGVTASATATYWLGLKAALQPQSTTPEAVARQIDHLPALGVDPELVRQGQLVAEKTRASTATARSLAESPILYYFRRSTRATFDAQLEDLAAQCRAVERMRPDLTARYGMEFPTLDLPTP